MILSKETTLSDLRGIVTKVLKEAIQNPKHAFRYCSLATAGDHELAMRTVVLRAVNESMHLFFYTDARSSKIKELLINPKTALLFYDKNEQFQVRLSGSVRVHHQNDIADHHWSKVSEDKKKEYNTEKRPSEVIEQIVEGHRLNEEMSDSSFAVIEITPQNIDLLQLASDGHIRANINYHPDKWECSWIVP